MMKPDKKKVEEFLDRYLPSASKEEMEADGARVLRQLTSKVDLQSDFANERTIDSDFPRFARTWRQFVPIRVMAALAFFALLLASLFNVFVFPANVFAIVETVTGSVYQMSDGKQRALTVGERIETGTPVRTDRGSNAVLKLPGGSVIEMHPESELSLERTADGMNIRLSDGSVNVAPAKEPAGKLYVQNMQVTEPISKTVFQSSATPAVQDSPDQLPDKFDAASIRPSVPLPTGEGVRGNNTTRLGCSTGEIQLDPRRFAVTNVNLYTLITMAYASPGRDCQFFSLTDSLTGGPGWVRSDQFDIQAAIPERTPGYTATQFRKGESPEVQKMLLALLEDRFKLVLGRETKEMTGFALVLGKAKDAAQLAELAAETIRRSPVVLFPQGPLPQGAPLVPMRTGTGRGMHLVDGRNASMTELAARLAALTGKPVVDRTGLTGQFTFDLQYEQVPDTLPGNQGRGRPLNEASTSSLLKALENQLGLELEPSRNPMEVLVITHAEKPTEN